MNREGFLIRAGAALIDGVICVIPVLVLILIFGRESKLAAAGITIIVVGYSTLEIFRSGTFGKTLLKLKICNEDGSDASRNVLIKRWAIKQAYNLIYLVSAIT